MGVVYNFLEFLNAGVLPNTSTQPTSPFLQFLVGISRKTLSKTMVGDLVLWMLDHGIILPERGNGNTDTQTTNSRNGTCVVTGFASESLQLRSTDNYQVGKFRSFKSKFTSEIVITSENTGSLDRIETVAYIRESPDGVNSVVSSFRTYYTWTRHNSPLWIVSRLTTGSRTKYDYIAPGYVGNDVVSDLTIPVLEYETQSLCFGTNSSYDSCGGGFTYPALLELVERPSCEVIDLPDEPDPEPILIFGVVKYYLCNNIAYYPAFSSVGNLTKGEALEFLQSLPLLEFTLPVPAISSDLVARAVFGDIDPPLWYSQEMV